MPIVAERMKALDDRTRAAVAKLQHIAHETMLTQETQVVSQATRLAQEQRMLREGRPLIRALQTIERSLRFASGRHDVVHEGMKHAILKSED